MQWNEDSCDRTSCSRTGSLPAQEQLRFIALSASLAGFVTKRANSAIRVKGIDEPSDSDNTWENAESDGKKGAHRLEAVCKNLTAHIVSMAHRFGLQIVQV